MLSVHASAVLSMCKPAPMTYRAFVAFSGGGAKGIVHVGALKALEVRNVRFLGLAGTSAGSIVATLAAAGFRADDLINPASGTSILERLAVIDPKLRRATGVFGNGWWRVWIFRALARQPIPISWIVGLIWISPLAAALVILRFSVGWALAVGALGWAAVGVLFWVAYRSITKGLANVGVFRDSLDRLLQEKMFPGEPGRVVTMADFGSDGRPALKIVSANLTKRKLHLFSPERTPKVPVADAVAASICLPLIFSPWCVGGDLHVDGGIVSNLPAWPFDEERELDPEALTIAVEIETSQEPTKAGEWLQAITETALFGSAELNLRVSGPAERLALPTRLDMLDFDIEPAAAATEVGEVAAAAGVRLDKRLFRLPEIYRDACQVAQALACDGLGIVPGGRGEDPRVRVAVGRLERGYCRSLRLSYSVGYESDTDETMLVPIDGSVAGAAWNDRQSVLEIVPLGRTRDLPGAANRLRRKARWPGLAWVMCIPILDDESGVPRLLVQLDGNTELAEDTETEEALNGVEQAVKEFFKLVLDELRELEDDDGLQE